MTEPTRDALHAETLAMLERIRPITLTPHGSLSYVGPLLAHAAACVKRVPELEAEVERLRDALEYIVDADDPRWTDHCTTALRPTPRTDI